MSGETESNVSGWTTDTLHLHVLARFVLERDVMQKQLDDLIVMLDERYGTQTKAVDAAFLAQQTAMQTALTAAERAVQTALLSAEKAVGKAELAADKRFEAVNGFREQLNSQASMFITRAEALSTVEATRTALEAAVHRNSERLNELSGVTNALISRAEVGAIVTAVQSETRGEIGRNTDRLQELTDRVNRSEGRGTGLNAGYVYLLAALGALGTMVSIFLAVRPG